MSDTHLQKLMNAGGPAFPSEFDEFSYRGMTIRDYFAAAAVQGILAGGSTASYSEERADQAYKIADAMLERRNQ